MWIGRGLRAGLGVDDCLGEGKGLAFLGHGFDGVTIVLVCSSSSSSKSKNSTDKDRARTSGNKYCSSSVVNTHQAHSPH